MDDRKLALRILLVGLVAVACLPLVYGCASQTLTAGQSVCTGSKAECDELRKIVASLHTPEMNAAIAEARK